MKLLTITIPCYNSEGYMRKCVESLLSGGEDVEIIIVNDGSKDNTAVIADEYKEKYPSIVKVVHKENGGHGSAVNARIDHPSRGHRPSCAALRSGLCRGSYDLRGRGGGHPRIPIRRLRRRSNDGRHGGLRDHDDPRHGAGLKTVLLINK